MVTISYSNAGTRCASSCTSSASCPRNPACNGFATQWTRSVTRESPSPAANVRSRLVALSNMARFGCPAIIIVDDVTREAIAIEPITTD